MKRTSLRTRLVIASLGVCLLAIVAVNVTTIALLHSSLLERVDRQLNRTVVLPPQVLLPEVRSGLRDDARDQAPDELFRGQEDGPGFLGGGRPERPGPAPLRDLPAGTWIGIVGEDGGQREERVVQADTSGEVDDSQRPKLDRHVLEDAQAGEVTSTDSREGDGSFRITGRPTRDGDMILVAIPTDDVQNTVRRLARIEVLVSLVAGLGAAMLAWTMIARGTRPLLEMAQAAEDVAAEVTRSGPAASGIATRVPEPSESVSELGQLAGALNTMLAEIDDAFAERHRSEEQLRRFVADASHELRTPLTSIRGYAELARRSSDEMSAEDLASALGQIEGESSHMSRLVEDLLLLSQMDEGLPLRRETCDVAEIAAQAVDAARTVEPGREVLFESGGSVRGNVDPVRVRQVLDNLLANVRTHAGDGASASVRVRTSGTDAVLEVQDTGAGLDAAQLETARERFWRADRARARTSGGSGLGLSIVDGIVQAHGGSLELAQGPEGRGLLVRVTLPLAPPS